MPKGSGSERRGIERAEKDKMRLSKFKMSNCRLLKK